MFFLIVVLLILAGIVLLIIEFFVIPGITFAGIIGTILVGFGIYAAYKTYGVTTGNYTTGVSLVVFIGILIYMFKTGSYKKISLKSEIDSKVNTLEPDKFKPGDKGITVSRLNPMGKVKVNNIITEAKSLGIYIDENTEIEVIKVNGSNIIVKPLK